MKTISLITVYNNKSLVDEMIHSAQKQKNIEVDYVMIDNTSNKFSSAAQALNYGTEKAKGEVLVFLHQDIEFLSDDVLEYLYDYAVRNPDVLLGAAGVKYENTVKKPPLLSSIAQEDKNVRFNSLEKPEEVFILDECLMACHKECMKKVSFDEKICDGWHLYGADLCLQAKNFAGLRVVVIPLDILHKSHGNADGSYFKTQNLLAKKYKKYNRIIHTTNGYVYTNFMSRFAQNIYRKLKYKI